MRCEQSSHLYTFGFAGCRKKFNSGSNMQQAAMANKIVARIYKSFTIFKMKIWRWYKGLYAADLIIYISLKLYYLSF